MLLIQELKNKHLDLDIYIIGTGASTAFFPKDFLDNKITIGLNKAWEMIPNLNYSITIHPELNINFDNEYCTKKIKWIAKQDKLSELSRSQLTEISRLYLFNTKEDKSSAHLPNQPKETSRDLNLINPSQNQYLYQWSTIAATAMHVAYIMGARNIFLIGCDCAPLNGADHAKAQHTRWRGSSPQTRYSQYKEAIIEVREKLLSLDTNVLNLMPFIGISGFEWEANLIAKSRNIDLQKSLGDIDPVTLRDWIIWAKINIKKFLKIYLLRFRK